MDGGEVAENCTDDDDDDDGGKRDRSSHEYGMRTEVVEVKANRKSSRV